MVFLNFKGSSAGGVAGRIRVDFYGWPASFKGCAPGFYDWHYGDLISDIVCGLILVFSATWVIDRVVGAILRLRKSETSKNES